MNEAAGFLGIVAIIVVAIGYQSMLRKGMRTRIVATSLSDDEIRRLFIKHVVGSTWKLVADGEPMIAQSSLVSGIRQQIALSLGDDSNYPGRTIAKVEVIRYVRKVLGGPTKAHTLRIRMNAFMNAVARADRSAINLTDGASSAKQRPVSEISPVPYGPSASSSYPEGTGWTGLTTAVPGCSSTAAFPSGAGTVSPGSWAFETARSAGSPTSVPTSGTVTPIPADLGGIRSTIRSKAVLPEAPWSYPHGGQAVSPDLVCGTGGTRHAGVGSFWNACGTRFAA